MRRSLNLLASVLGIASLVPLVSHAAENTAIEERLANYRPNSMMSVPADEALLTGDNDLVLLRYHKFFTLEGNAGYTLTNNAFLSDINRSTDSIYDASVTARAATRIAQKYDLFAETSILAARYAKNDELGYNGVALQVGGSAPVGDYHVGAVYGMTMAFDRGGFVQSRVTLHDWAMSINRTFALSANTVIVPQMVLGRTFADPIDYNVWSARAGVNLVHRMRPSLIGVAGVDFSYRRYDNYFQAFTGKQRSDTGVRLTGGLRWQLCEMATVTGGMAFAVNSSTVHANDYHAFTASPTVRLSIRF